MLRRLRLRRGLSMRGVGERLNYSSCYISQIENGRERPPTGARLIRFLDVYGIKPKYFAQLTKEWTDEITDDEIIFMLLPKLKPGQITIVKSLVEQLAKGGS